MQTLDAAIQASIDAGEIILRGMILFDFPSGQHGFWDGAGPYVWNGVTFHSHNSLLEVSPVRQSGNLSSSPMTVKLRAMPEIGLTPDVLATIETESYKNRPAFIYFAFFDPDTRVLLGGAPLLVWEGEVDTISHDQSGGEYVLTAHLETRERDYTKKGARVRGHQDQKRLYPTDGFLKHADNASTVKEYFGQNTPKSAKVD